MKNSHLLKERVGVYRWANYEMFRSHMVTYYKCHPSETRNFWKILKKFTGAKKVWNTNRDELCIKVCVLPRECKSKAGVFLN